MAPANQEMDFSEVLKAYVANNKVSPKELPEVIKMLKGAMAEASGSAAAPTQARQTGKAPAKAKASPVPAAPAKPVKTKAKKKVKKVKKAAKKVAAKSKAQTPAAKKTQAPALAQPALAASNAPFVFEAAIATAAMRKSGGAKAPMLGIRAPNDPFVPIKDSLQRDYIVCLEDGKRLKMLKRHIRASYGFSPDTYRAKWGLPDDYPMVAEGYSKEKSSYAKIMGLGTTENKQGKHATAAKISKRAVRA